MELAGKGADIAAVSEAEGQTEEEGEKSNKEGEEGGDKEEQIGEGLEGESPSSQAASSFPSMTSSRCQTASLQIPPMSSSYHSHFQQVPQCRLSDPGGGTKIGSGC